MPVIRSSAIRHGGPWRERALLATFFAGGPLGFVDEAATPGGRASLSTHLNRWFSNTRRSTQAQAMVEFALALPIFLMLVYGLLETGRLIFMYATVATASRDAVRYASVAGWNNTASQTPHYQDCAGIRAAAKNVGFLINLQDNQINIAWDRPGSSPAAGGTYCTPGNPTDTSVTLQSGDRVIVTVTTQYRLAVPIVPFTSRTISSGPTARTFLGVIDLIATPTPSSP